MPVFSTAKEKRIIRLMEKGCTPKEIMTIENTSYTPIRRLSERLGMEIQRHNTKAEVMLEESQFKCSGIGNCSTCKRLFQYPCKLGYDS
jgi:hypothetical protein